MCAILDMSCGVFKSWEVSWEAVVRPYLLYCYNSSYAACGKSCVCPVFVGGKEQIVCGKSEPSHNKL